MRILVKGFKPVSNFGNKLIKVQAKVRTVDEVGTNRFINNNLSNATYAKYFIDSLKLI